ncbi:hypothetical protein WA026_010962 [Henosepilachna vigintioctopunctata]|uniref:Uncharacterized protein n=1 Tax=Henosepilachna vigintioctopunctata TaxID=420089 RepID=A0AAW1UY79_9CUCU
MKVLGLFLIALVVYTQAVEDGELQQKWAEFQAKFGKSYRSPLEARKRLSIFKQNLEEIDAHNAKYEKGLSTYQKGINQFADWTNEEFNQYVNKGLKGVPKPIAKPFKAIEGEEIPDSIDWREKGAVNAVKNQGSCGCCWAFSAAAAIEGALAISSGKLQSLSEQNLNDCSHPEGNNGCHGGWMHQAFEYVQKNGIESEADYPYLAKDEKCKADSSKVVTKVSDYVQIESGNEEQLKNAIARQPVSIAIVANNNLRAYHSGVFSDPFCIFENLNHGVVAVGYGTENGQDYYLVRNSWGEEFGDKGYFKLARNKGNMCGVTDVAHYPVI